MTYFKRCTRLFWRYARNEIAYKEFVDELNFIEYKQGELFTVIRDK
jgi:hypothetical protein